MFRQSTNQNHYPVFGLWVTSLDGINGPSIQTLLRGENDSKQSDEFQAILYPPYVFFIFFTSLPCVHIYFVLDICTSHTINLVRPHHAPPSLHFHHPTKKSIYSNFSWLLKSSLEIEDVNLEGIKRYIMGDAPMVCILQESCI